MDLPLGVRTAFGLSGATAVRLPGGGGVCWQVGDVVCKPGQSTAVASWLADVYAGLAGPGFTVPEPVRAVDGSWVVDGWAAWTAVDGVPAPVARWPELVAASRAFHSALVGVPAPRWIGRGRNRWAVAERVAWDGERVEVAPELADLVDALKAAMRPVRLPDQLVHTDIAGNVLFAEGRPPAVIDFSPSWRPAGYALAVAAVDLLTWSAASPDILDNLADEDELDQLLLRALVWRLVTESLGRPDAEGRQAVRRANEPVVDLVLARATGRTPTMAPISDAGLAESAGKLLGTNVTGLRPVEGGHSRCVTRLADTVFLKASSMPSDLAVELAVYEGLGERPFLPRLLAAAREPTPLLALEALSPDGWVRGWTPRVITTTRSLLHEVHRLPAPPGVPVLGKVANPWDADPTRLLSMNVCSEVWLGSYLDTLGTAAAQAVTEGESLIHRDVRAANLWYDGERLVLVDWASAAIGNPWLDLHLWLVAVHAEGGPPPEANQGPHAAGHAALIAGLQPQLTPARDADPVMFAQRCRRMSVALSWAARQLGIPEP